MFLRTIRATIIAGVALPLSLIATFGVMWFCGFSLDNLSLMALTIGTGFVIDDAIVMIENIVRHIEEGEEPFEAAMRGAKEIGFTVISLTVSLVAVFIPLLFMSGIVGRMFREFALTLTVAVITSAIVSLTLTPMMCSRLLRHGGDSRDSAVTRRLQSRRRRRGQRLSPQPRMGAAPRAGDARRHHRDPGRDRLALCHHPQGLPADPGHRPDHGGDRGGSGSLVRRDAAPAAAHRRRDAGRSRRHRRRLGGRRYPHEPDPECGPPRHHAEAARRPHELRHRHRRPAEARGRVGPRDGRLFPAGPGHPDRHPRLAARCSSTP